MRGSKTPNDATDAPDAQVGSNSVHSHSQSLQMAHFLQSGWRVAASLLVPSFIGIGFDELFGSEPIFTIIGVVLGVVLVFIVTQRFVNSRFYSGGKK